MNRDQQICSSLEEKLQVYAALSALSGKADGLPVGPRLLVQPQWEEPPLQAAALLAAAVKEGEMLIHLDGCSIMSIIFLIFLKSGLILNKLSLFDFS